MSSRGKNFTEREKCQLMEIISKYKYIIENKCTNSGSVVQKHEAWESITVEFNSSAETPRTQKQLHTAYLNLKRTTRQNVANENIKKYLQNKQLPSTVDFEPGPSQEDTVIVQDTVLTETISQNSNEINYLLKQLRKDDTADKKGIMATGGGVYKPMLSSVGAQVLAIMGDQVNPLSNSFDSASSYFNNVENVSNVIKTPISSQADKPTLQPIRKPIKKLKRKTNCNTDHLKRKYYVTKIQCSILEKKTRLLEYKTVFKKQKLLELELKIKEKEYEHLLNRSLVTI